MQTEPDRNKIQHDILNMYGMQQVRSNFKSTSSQDAKHVAQLIIQLRPGKFAMLLALCR